MIAGGYSAGAACHKSVAWPSSGHAGQSVETAALCSKHRAESCVVAPSPEPPEPRPWRPVTTENTNVPSTTVAMCDWRWRVATVNACGTWSTWWRGGAC